MGEKKRREAARLLRGEPAILSGLKKPKPDNGRARVQPESEEEEIVRYRWDEAAGRYREEVVKPRKKGVRG